MADEPKKRQVARKLWIRDVLNGTYVKEEGFKPNYVLLQDNSRAARVNLLGVVVSTGAEGLPTLVLDDGSARISIRAFEPSVQMSTVQVGDVILMIGRPRQFGTEMYVLPEIVRKITDLGWLEVRKCELSAIISRHPSQQPQNTTEEVVDESFGLTENVLGAIRSLDVGPGADTQAVIEQIGVRDAEKTIHLLLKNGDISEVSHGK